jgi:hypothetical protein
MLLGEAQHGSAVAVQRRVTLCSIASKVKLQHSGVMQGCVVSIRFSGQ